MTIQIGLSVDTLNWRLLISYYFYSLAKTLR